MDYNRYSYTPTRYNRTSVIELQEQCRYTLDVDVRKGDKITGGFGKTFYKAQWIDHDESPVLLIEMKGNKISEEVYLYLTLDHPHIIKTYGLVDPNDHSMDFNTVLLLQEYAKDGDLGGLLSNRYFIPEQNVLLEIFIQVADAMVFLSKSGIIHGDLACRNVLVFKSHPHNPKLNLVKLIDFGSTQNDSQSSTGRIDVPMRYVALEILRSQGRSDYSQKSDVYSFGVFMWEACSFGRMPYDYIDDDNEVCRQKLQGQRLTRPDKCDPNVWKLMDLCWNDRPDNRPTFEMIHRQLQNIQNIEISSPSRNSPLFQIEYEVCKDCSLRYTDAGSHLNRCGEQKMTCYKCNKEYRRAIYDNHEKNCNGPSNDTIELVSPVYPSPYKQLYADKNFYSEDSNEVSLPSFMTSNADDSSDSSSDNDEPHFNSLYPTIINTHKLRSWQSLPVETSTNLQRTNTFRKPVPRNLSNVEKIELPCEICNKPIDASQFQSHQIECKKKDEERIEKQRRKIEQTETEIEIECDFCHETFSVEDYDIHQNICSSESNNHFESESARKSFRNRGAPTTGKQSISLDESRNIWEDDYESESRHNPHTLKRSETLNEMEIKKLSAVVDELQQTGFKKLLSRLSSSKKKY